VVKPNMVSLEAPKRANRDGALYVSLGDLVKNALRMTPDRIIVGEIRDSIAANAFLEVINTGHSGVMTTLHADSIYDSTSRLQDLVSRTANMNYEMISKSVYRNVHVLIHCEKTARFGKRVVGVGEIRGDQIVSLFSFDYVNDQHIEHSESIESSLLIEACKKSGVESWLW